MGEFPHSGGFLLLFGLDPSPREDADHTQGESSLSVRPFIGTSRGMFPRLVPVPPWLTITSPNWMSAISTVYLWEWLMNRIKVPIRSEKMLKTPLCHILRRVLILHVKQTHLSHYLGFVIKLLVYQKLKYTSLLCIVNKCLIYIPFYRATCLDSQNSFLVQRGHEQIISSMSLISYRPTVTLFPWVSLVPTAGKFSSMFPRFHIQPSL